MTTQRTLIILITFVCATLLAIIGLAVIELIPGYLFAQNARSASTTFNSTPQTRPRLLGDLNGTTLDYYGDALMYQLTLANEDAPLLERMLSPLSYAHPTKRDDGGNDLMAQGLASRLAGQDPNTLHNHYWDGYRIPLRIFGSVLSYTGLRVLSGVVLLLLVCATTGALWRVLGRLVALAFLISFLAMYAPIVAWCLQYAPVFYIAFAGIIAVLYLAKKRLLLSHGYLLFLILGILTSFFDLLTAPLITVGFPLVVAITCLLRSNLKEDAQAMLHHGFTWCALWFVGYAGFWFIKVMLTSALLDTTLPGYVSEKTGFYFGGLYPGLNGYIRTFLDAFYRNLGTVLGASFRSATYLDPTIRSQARISLLLLVAPLLTSWFLSRRRSVNLGTLWLLVAVMLVPLSRMIIMAAHTSIHDFMTFREWGVAYFALLVFLGFAIPKLRRATSADLRIR